MDVQRGRAGWYPDEEVPGGLRFWDGDIWTEHRWRHPASTVQRAHPDRYDVPGGGPKVGFGQAIGLALRQYARFDGRSSRSEYWWFTLFCVLISFTLSFLAGTAASSSPDATQSAELTAWDVAHLIFVAAILLPGLAVAVRRLHDTGRSGAWVFLGLIPLVGTIILIVFYASPGEPVPNQYGDPPAKGQLW